MGLNVTDFRKVAVTALLAGIVLGAGGVMALHHLMTLPESPATRGDHPPAELPVWSLTLKNDDAAKLASIRKRARERGWYVAADQDWTKGELTTPEGTFKLKVRPKGDLVAEHHGEENYSLRCRVRKGDAVDGLTRFSLMHPRQRGWLWEWLYHRCLRDEGLAGLHYEFVNLRVNGKDFGPYAVEGHFEASVAPANRRREGPIVRFREDGLWGPDRLYDRELMKAHRGDYYVFSGDVYLKAEVDVFSTDRNFKDPDLARRANDACNLLDGFRHGRLTASEVFKVDETSKFFALSDVLGGIHGLEWRNMRFLYDPVAARLEPVGYDGQGAGRRIDALIPNFHIDHSHRMDLWRDLFSDERFCRTYIEHLSTLSSESWVDTALRRHGNRLKGLSAALAAAGIEDRSRLHLIDRNASFIRNVLSPPNPVGIWRRPDGSLVAANLQTLPAEITSIEIDGTARVLPAPVRLPTRWTKAPLVITTIPGAPVPGDSRIIARIRIPGLDQAFSATARPWIRDDAVAPPRGTPNVDLFPFLVQEDSGWRIPAGTWTVDRTLILPDGDSLSAGPDSRLQLGDGASVIVRGPLLFEGSPEKPVVIQGLDSAPGGIAVIDSARPSRLENVLFTGLGAPESASWKLTGAVTFYESDVLMVACAFDRARSEDALNIVRSQATLTSCRASDSHSDALDFDFCEVNLVDMTVHRSGNDALDVSGTRIAVRGFKAVQCGDKGLSAGESSHVNFDGGSIRDAVTGIASKDRSRVWINDLELRGCVTDLAAYVKKPEYGASELLAYKLVLETERPTVRLEDGCRLEVDGQPVTR